MAEYRHTPSSVVSLPGTSGGQPHYERNTALPISETIIGTGTPRLYDEIISQWGVVRAEYEDLRSAASDLEVETVLCGATSETPEGDESEIERRFNSRLEGLLLGDRLHIEAGDGHDRGIGYLLAWGVEAVAHGFSVAEPYWLEEGGIMSARLCVRPLERSAAYRWGVDRSGARVDPRPLGLYYLTAECGQQWIPYDDLLHITNPGARPGHWYGLLPLLRATVGPFKRWRLNQINAAGAELASRGRLVITEPESNDDANARRIDALIDADADGRLTGFRLPHGTSAEMMFPAGSPPDFRSTEQGLTETIRSIFNNGAAALGLSTHGSRAVAEEMGAEDRRRAAARRNEIVGKIWHRMCAWVARQEGYTGRLRTLTSRMDVEVDAATVVQLSAQAAASGLVTITPADQAYLRGKIGLPSMEDAGLAMDAVERGGDVLVGALVQQTEILARLTPADPAIAPLAPGAAITLLTKTGFSESEARQSVEQQITFMQSRDAQNAATQSTQGLAEHPTHPRSCGCVACGVRLDEGETFEIGGYVAVRPPLTVMIKGVDVQPETWMMWADEQEQRAQLDAELEREFANIADTQRDATWDALDDLSAEDYRPDLPELQSVYDDAVTQYQGAAERYVQRVRANTSSEVEASAARQAESGQAPRVDGNVDLDRLRERADAKVEQARNAAMLAAEEAASRVQGEVERSWVSSGSRARRSFDSRITSAGLARSAHTAGNAMEVAATLETAADTDAAPQGWRIVALTRTAILDGNACAHCLGEDGATFVEEDGDLTKVGPEGDTPEGTPWRNYPDLPDDGPGRCEGRERCRCRFAAVWGR